MAGITAEQTCSSTVFSSSETAAPSEISGGLISIVIPVFNEATLLEQCLTNLRRCAPGAEIIVVDGRSTDETRQLASDLCDQLITTDCNRAMQMNAGARAAHGDTLWFMHVDVEIPSGCLEEIANALDDTTAAGGYFRIRLPDDRFVYRFTDVFAHYAGLILRMRCGDHGLFCRRAVFERLGGFPQVSLMEDVDLFRAMHRFGRVRTIETRLCPSTRRYETIGATRLTFAYGLIATLYAFGVSRRTLNRIYERLCDRRAI